MKHFLRLLGYMRPYVLYSFLSFVLMAVVGALASFRILLLKPIFDSALSKKQATDVLVYKIPFTSHSFDLQIFIPHYFHNVGNIIAVALVGSAIIKSLCDYAGTVLANRAGFGMVNDLRDDLYDSLLWRSMAFFRRHSTGTLTSTLINDVDRVQTAMSSVLSDFLQQLFTLIFMVCTVFITGGKLAWVLLLFVPVVVSSAKRIGRSVRHTTRRGQDKLAEIQSIVVETTTGNSIVKAFGMEGWEMRRFRRAAQRLLNANMKSVAVQSISSPLMDALGAVGIALLLYIGRQSIVNGDTTGNFATFVVAIIALYDPVRKMPVFYNSFQQAVGASEKIFQFMDEQDEVPEKKKAVTITGFEGKIEFKNVGFSYQHDGESTEILHDVSLNIHRGEVIALVGPSGAGKSTFVNLLPRFYDVSCGSILLDNHDVRDLSIVSLRKQIGKVTQDTVLFNDTVRNNIAYGQPDIPIAKIHEAARMALAHDFIERMPEGYETVIGERGLRLSGGERQRLAIARAILKNAPILILDEATSALDTESELAVQAALSNLMQGRTVLMIAHRLSTVRKADRIAVMEHGRITEFGSHDELLELARTYSRLYNLQFGETEIIPVVEVDVVPAGVEGTA